MTMQSDRDAALCERLRARVLPGRISEMSDGTRALDPLCQSAADRLESLSRQLSDVQRENERLEDMAAVGESLLEAIADNSKSPPLQNWAPADGPAEVVVDLLNWLADAQRERDELRAAVSAARAEITQRKTRYASSDVAAIAANWSRGFADATQGALEILAYYVPAEHTEGGKP